LAYDVLAKSPATSINFISKCAQLAAAMAKVAEQLMDESTVLRDEAETALVMAAEDRKDFNDQEKKNLADRLAAEARRKELASTQAAQAELLELKRREEKDAIKRADKENSDKMFMAVLNAVAGAVGNAAGAMNPASTAGKVAQAAASGLADSQKGGSEEKKEEPAAAAPASADALAMQINSQIYDLEKKQIADNAELRKKIEQIKNMKSGEDTIKQAMEAIELTIKALGKIKVIFSNVRFFWQGVELQCQNLAGVGGKIQEFRVKPHLFQQNILDLIEESALNWFTLLKVNYYGKQAIAEVDKKMDGIFDDLKDASEAKSMLDDMAKALADDLDAEDAVAARSIAAKDNAAKALTDGKEKQEDE